ncbi:hypothetical protein AB0I28_05645 [Phytomonospora sp. NPDC050363]|uniref:hypothetical protein n=1 Tax=Phytomonospora sp. NPDC050363 TaxID=3155642 RepID=UPI0033FC38A9
MRPLLSGQVLRVLTTIGGFAALLAGGVIGFEADTGWHTVINGFWPLVGAAVFLLILTWVVSAPSAARRMRRRLTFQGATGPDDPVWGTVRVGRHGFAVDGPAEPAPESPIRV